MFAEKIAILDQIKKQPSNTSQCQLAEITGVQKSTTARWTVKWMDLMQRKGEKDIIKNESEKARIQMLIRLSIGDSLS